MGFSLACFSDASALTTHEARNSQFLTVCGDPNHLPYSNVEMAGFENRIAQLIADTTGRTLRYRWWPQTIGFVRNTLQVRLCDLVMGITSVNELVQNTNPYYRSVYTLVYRRNSGLELKSLGDPALRHLRLGVVAGTPPATLLSRYDLMEQTRSYQRTVDTRHFSPASDAVGDVAAGNIDVAVIWGPIAGYSANRQDVPLVVSPLPANEDSVQLAYNVSMGIRRRETQWKHQLNELIDKLAPQIAAILLEYRVPLLDHENQPITGAATSAMEDSPGTAAMSSR
ncbi:MAG: quinoprotein dehydrogenase-associated putative ABC transporter substrate-binding protein [Gammaproteobacteria bacterium]|nr:quinoprotein dehydrogenase-associated putative ABC transporter substrate-binding protein [Gammaproteobacteria bacterium]